MLAFFIERILISAPAANKKKTYSQFIKIVLCRLPDAGLAPPPRGGLFFSNPAITSRGFSVRFTSSPWQDFRFSTTKYWNFRKK